MERWRCKKLSARYVEWQKYVLLSTTTSNTHIHIQCVVIIVYNCIYVFLLYIHYLYFTTCRGNQLNTREFEAIYTWYENMHGVRSDIVIDKEEMSIIVQV